MCPVRARGFFLGPHVYAHLLPAALVSKPVEGLKITQMGAVSPNDDPTIGNVIAAAMKKVGKDGVITVKEPKTMETTLEVAEGRQFDRGYLSPCFVTDPSGWSAHWKTP